MHCRVNLSTQQASGVRPSPCSCCAASVCALSGVLQSVASPVILLYAPCLVKQGSADCQTSVHPAESASSIRLNIRPVVRILALAVLRVSVQSEASPEIIPSCLC